MFGLCVVLEQRRRGGEGKKEERLHGTVRVGDVGRGKGRGKEGKGFASIKPRIRGES